MKTCRRGLHQFEGRTCLECKKAKAAEWHAANSERIKEKRSAAYASDPAAANAKRVEWGRKNSEFNIWIGMRNRCDDPKNKAYKNYGGRGITVCDRWLGENGYQNFLSDIGRRPTPKHEIDRENNNGNYEPGNCRWVLRIRNNRNRRSNLMITHNGKTQCAKDWAEELGINYKVLISRLYKLNWPVDVALAAPSGVMHTTDRMLTFKGKTQRVTDWAAEIGVKAPALFKRLEAGWSIEKALTTRAMKRFGKE